MLELDFDALFECIKGKKLGYEQFSRYPSVYKDLSVIVPVEVAAGTLQDLLKKESSLISSVVLYDIYQGRTVGENTRSLTFRIYFSSPEKTLTDEEINPLLMSMANTLVSECGAKLR